MIVATLRALVIAAVLGTSTLAAQERRGLTITAARAAFSSPTRPATDGSLSRIAPADCGSSLRNAVLLGVGLSLAAGVLELTYTLIREPFVRRGHDWPAARPVIIAWAGAAGFALGLAGTEMCRRRRR